MCSLGINDPQVGDYVATTETEAARKLELSMHAIGENVRLVRDLVNDGADMWALPPSVRRDGCLVLTELVTNVVKKYPGTLLKARISNPSNSLALDLYVWDSDPTQWPEMKEPGLDSLDGRGILMVHILTKGRWRWWPVDTPPGKVVTARVSP